MTYNPSNFSPFSSLFFLSWALCNVGFSQARAGLAGLGAVPGPRVGRLGPALVLCLGLEVAVWGWPLYSRASPALGPDPFRWPSIAANDKKKPKSPVDPAQTEPFSSPRTLSSPSRGRRGEQATQRARRPATGEGMLLLLPPLLPSPPSSFDPLPSFLLCSWRAATGLAAAVAVTGVCSTSILVNLYCYHFM